MRILILIFLVNVGFCSAAQAQSDIKVMLKQIALIAAHARELEKAIEIAREGLTTIHEIKSGEFNLHNLFFSSLESINPVIVKYSRIGVIVAEQISIVNDFKHLISELNAENYITRNEITYIKTVYDHMADECSKTLSDLIVVTTPGSLKMTDDERIKRIDGLYDDMNDKYAFTKQFTSTVTNLVSERQRKNNDLISLKNLR